MLSETKLINSIILIYIYEFREAAYSAYKRNCNFCFKLLFSARDFVIKKLWKKWNLNTIERCPKQTPKNGNCPENVIKVRRIVLGDRKLYLLDIAAALKISEGSVFIILHNYWHMKKLLANLTPKIMHRVRNQWQ